MTLPLLGTLGGAADQTGSGIRTLGLLDGAVRVRGPEGYCVDQSASAAPRGFAILVGCGLISDRAAVMPDRSGLITVQFGGGGSALVDADEDALAAFLNSAAGRDLLVSSGARATVTETHTGANLVLVRLQQEGAAEIPGVTSRSWRGFTDVAGRLVTVTVYSFERDPLANEAARTLLELTLSAIGNANRPAES